MGSFHIGGRHVEVKGQPVKEIVFTPGGVPAKLDPNGVYQVEQMYAQYYLVQNRKGRLPLLMWHGGGLSGVTYETKPDGHRRVAQLFRAQGLGHLHLRRDGARARRLDRQVQGRSECSCRSAIRGSVSASEPIGSWNDDKGKRAIYPGVQFPTDAYEQFMKQGVPRWVTTDEQIIAAYIELVDKVCPCVVLVHSQAGSFGFKVAEARPDKIKALIAVEPSAPATRTR